MHGAVARMVRSQGREYQLRNAERGGGDRETPTYEPDSTLTGVLERRSAATVETLSSGEAVETGLEIRAVMDDETTIVGAGESDWPTKLDHPDGQTFDVVATYPEDSGVIVLTVVRE